MDWWAARYDQPLELSVCVVCPFQSRSRWVETKRRWPELFWEAVATDANLRGWLALAKDLYQYAQRIPLAQASGSLGRSWEPVGNETGSRTNPRATAPPEVTAIPEG